MTITLLGRNRLRLQRLLEEVYTSCCRTIWQIWPKGNFKDKTYSLENAACTQREKDLFDPDLLSRVSGSRKKTDQCWFALSRWEGRSFLIQSLRCNQ